MAFAGGAGKQRDERLEDVPLVIGQGVIPGAAERGEDRGYARRVVGVFLAGEPRNSLHEANALFPVVVAALGEDQRIKVDDHGSSSWNAARMSRRARRSAIAFAGMSARTSRACSSARTCSCVMPRLSAGHGLAFGGP